MAYNSSILGCHFKQWRTVIYYHIRIFSFGEKIKDVLGITGIGMVIDGITMTAYVGSSNAKFNTGDMLVLVEKAI